MKKRRTLVAQPDRLAHRIAPVRKGLGLSQEAFAEAMGVSRNTVVTYEHGQTPCTAVLDRIARAGAVTANWLLHGPAPRRGVTKLGTRPSICCAGCGRTRPRAARFLRPPRGRRCCSH